MRSHVISRTSHVTRHTSHVTRHTSHVTRHTSHITRHTSHITRHTSHVTRHTSHVIRHRFSIGDDFQWEAALEPFSLWDEVIDAVNADGRVRVQYSTLDE